MQLYVFALLAAAACSSLPGLLVVGPFGQAGKVASKQGIESTSKLARLPWLAASDAPSIRYSG